MGKKIDYKKLRRKIEERYLRQRKEIRTRIASDLASWCNCRVLIEYAPGGTGPPIEVSGTVVGTTEEKVTLHDHEPATLTGPELVIDHINSITYLG